MCTCRRTCRERVFSAIKNQFDNTRCNTLRTGASAGRLRLVFGRENTRCLSISFRGEMVNTLSRSLRTRVTAATTVRLKANHCCCVKHWSPSCYTGSSTGTAAADATKRSGNPFVHRTTHRRGTHVCRTHYKLRGGRVSA